MKQLLFFIILLLISCNSGTNRNLEPCTKERTTVNAAAIKEYIEEVNDPLNPEWKFKVGLYEQKESLKYELRFQYKEVTGEKIFSVPNIGFDFRFCYHFCPLGLFETNFNITLPSGFYLINHYC